MQTGHSDTTTDGIRVRVASQFLPDGRLVAAGAMPQRDADRGQRGSRQQQGRGERVAAVGASPT